MSQEFDFPLYRKVRGEKIFIEIDKNKMLTSVGLDYVRKGRCHFDNTKHLSDIPKPIRKQLYAGIGLYRPCTEAEFNSALEYTLCSPELLETRREI